MDVTRRLLFAKTAGGAAAEEDEDATPLMTLSRTQTSETHVDDDDSSSETAGRDSISKPRHLERPRKMEHPHSDTDTSLAEGTSRYVRSTRHRRRWRLLCFATCGFVLL